MKTLIVLLAVLALVFAVELGFLVADHYLVKITPAKTIVNNHIIPR